MLTGDILVDYFLKKGSSSPATPPDKWWCVRVMTVSSRSHFDDATWNPADEWGAGHKKARDAALETSIRDRRGDGWSGLVGDVIIYSDKFIDNIGKKVRLMAAPGAQTNFAPRRTR
ncbi:hypothetical protein GWI33_007966 [Rhynchophorus ferrugineus]|uniref:Uncharacterized protein n=1 Tax=Rhynchophorus ferrugineus TaxID=354439 RepID=A0A834MBH1_RHYFE|nr:hypothetical protein GWI33_007966 [Rhynchophorus ferrugineus]